MCLWLVNQMTTDCNSGTGGTSSYSEFGKFVTVLSGKSASYNTVLAGLKQHSGAHFACRGFHEIQRFKSSKYAMEDLGCR